MSNIYTVNGVSLASEAWRIEVGEGLYEGPAPRGDDVAVPGAHGTLDLNADSTKARRRFGPGSIRFSMWVLGVDPDTGVGPGDEDDPAVFLDRIDQLQTMFNARTLTIVHERDDGDRECVARLAKPVSVVREPTSPLFGRFTADCVIPAGFWRDTTATTVTDATMATGDTLSLSNLAGNAPITDAVLTFGPCSNPMVAYGGSYFQYNGVIASGRQLVADTGSDTDGWSLDDGSGSAWTPSLPAVSYGPGPSWFEMDMTVLPRQVTLTHTGGGNASLSITARRKWLTS